MLKSTLNSSRLIVFSLLTTFGLAACMTYDMKRPRSGTAAKAGEPKIEENTGGEASSSPAKSQEQNWKSSEPGQVMTWPTIPRSSTLEMGESEVPTAEPEWKKNPEMGMPKPVDMGATPPVTPPSKPVPVQSYQEAVEQVDKAQVRDPNLKNFSIGSSYNLLTGRRTATCLNPTTLRSRVTQKRTGSGSYTLSQTYQELYKKLDTTFGADVGGFWQIFTGGLSFKARIVRESNVTNNDMVIISDYSYEHDEIAMENPGIDFAEFFQNEAQIDKHRFRSYCGDKFTKEVVTGANLSIVFTARKSDSMSYTKNEVDAALNIGLQGILNFGAKTTVNEEQRKILNSFTFSMKCHSIGVSPGICARFGEATNFKILDDAINVQGRILQARKDLDEELKKTDKYLTVIRETLEDYEVPRIACTQDGKKICPSRWSYFADYRERLTRLKEYAQEMKTTDDICSTPIASVWSKRCGRMSESLKGAIMSCQKLSEDCPGIDGGNLAVISSSINPGKVELYEHHSFGGKQRVIDFDSRILNARKFEPNQMYTWNDANVGGIKFTSFKTFLRDGWRIEFGGQKLNVPIVGEGWDRGNGNVGKPANDNMQHFKLIPPGDL